MQLSFSFLVTYHLLSISRSFLLAITINDFYHGNTKFKMGFYEYGLKSQHLRL